MSVLCRLAIEIAFEEELLALPDNYKNIILTISDYLPENFIRRSASSTKKYHNVVDNMEPWGLILHTKSVVMIAKELIRTRPDLMDMYDKVIVACILHDFVKYTSNNDMTEHTKKDHDVLGSNLAMSAGLDVDIQTMILLHQGIWNSLGFDEVTDDPDNDSSIWKLLKPGCSDKIKDLVWIVHHSDIIASRKFIEINHTGIIMRLNNEVLPMMGERVGGKGNEANPN